MNEAETRAELIDPALKQAGWGVVEGSRTRREVITKGRLLGGGRRGKQDIADYVLTYRGLKLAIIEAKKRSLAVTEGVGQAKRYAEKMHIRFTYATNGEGIYQIDMETGKESHIDSWPSPDQLWRMSFDAENQWRDRFAAVPFEDKGGAWEARYYQYSAITAALDAIAQDKPRILLNLATGTGKTFIAFQLAWKLFQSRWNLSRAPSRLPRILFLADRNILADQAFNDFSSFSEDALSRIAPDEIKKKGRVPKNASIFFTIFQTFMSGRDEEGRAAPYFGEYPADFFDFIIIDECHRGGANDESSWRGILEYFSPAVQLGLTATPKRKDNGDTYAYFGEPVYTYSLKDGINDGFLSPFRVKQIATTMDDYIYTVGDQVIQGELDKTKVYSQAEMNKIIEIEGRERYRVKVFLDSINPLEKTIFFCKDQNHALLIRDLVSQLKVVPNPNYCMRVTANDGKLGEKHLRDFQNNEKNIPTMLTTSQKLSTGVNARNVRNIVLFRLIGSMTEFKQIVGRGTRLFEGKDHFTIYDFEKNYLHFEDEEWDGEPLPPEGNPKDPQTPKPDGFDDGDEQPPLTGQPEGKEKFVRIKIVLPDNRERSIKHMTATTFWSTEGKPISATDFLKKLFGDLPDFFADEDELIKLWSEPQTRTALIDGLTEKGYSKQDLIRIGAMVEAEQSDLFDVLSYIAFAKVPKSRSTRAQTVRRDFLSSYDDKLQAFLNFVLDQYIAEGGKELDEDNLARLVEVKYQSLDDGAAHLGSLGVVRQAFLDMQKYLFGGEGHP